MVGIFNILLGQFTLPLGPGILCPTLGVSIFNVLSHQGCLPGYASLSPPPGLCVKLPTHFLPSLPCHPLPHNTLPNQMVGIFNVLG